MTIEQRKIELISSITNIDNESLLEQMQELVNNTNTFIPQEIMALLDRASSEKRENLRAHTSARDILKR